MSDPSVTALLIEAPAGRHFAQLHKDSQSLARAVGVFVEAGLRRDDAVIMVVPRSRIASYLRQVRDAGVDPDPRRLSRQLVVFDTETILERVMRDDMPVWERFRDAMVPAIEAAAASGRRVTRIYGELVNNLWRVGNTAAAIQLEEHWNELAHQHRFCLFCGYELDGFDEKTYEGPIQDIGRTHFAVPETAEDACLHSAVDAASKEMLGSPLSEMVSHTSPKASSGEHRLPIGRRTMLWLRRNMPNTMVNILRRARHFSRHEK